MKSKFDKIAKKAEEFEREQQKALAERKAKIKIAGRNMLGIKGAVKTKKPQRKSKVARGIEMICVIVAGIIALAVVNLNIWPFSLINGGEKDLSAFSAVLTFLVIALPLFIIGILITRPTIKRLEKKYGKQAW